MKWKTGRSLVAAGIVAAVTAAIWMLWALHQLVQP